MTQQQQPDIIEEENVADLQCNHISRQERRIPRSAISSPAARNNNTIVWRWVGLNKAFRKYMSKEPHNTTLYDIHSKYLADTADSSHLLPEHIRDRTALRKMCCISLRATDGYSHYWLDVFHLCYMLSFPLIALTLFATSLAHHGIDVQILFYVGMLFYILLLPYFPICISMACYEMSYHAFIAADSWTLIKLLSVPVFLCTICSPVYGIYLAATFQQAQSSRIGLQIGAYVAAALGLPLASMIVLLLVLSLFTVNPKICSRLLRGMPFSALTTIVIAAFMLTSAIHQGISGNLLWFPYLSVPGLLLGLPILISCFLGATIYAVLFYMNGDVHENYNIKLLWIGLVSYSITVDVAAYAMLQLNYTEKVSELVQQDLVIAGAAICYVFGICLICLGILMTHEVLQG